MPKRIRAFCYNGKYHHIPVEDDATIYAEYENGATATFITTTGEYPGTNRLEISGSRGKIVIEHGKLVFTELSECERHYCFNAKGREYPEQTESVYEEKNQLSGHKLILRNFAEHILAGENLISPGFDGIYELTLSNAAYLSAWTDGWVELPFDEEAFVEQLSLRKQGEQSEKPMEKETEDNTGYLNRWQVQW
jgi:predicted dehydrogenase